MSYRASQKHDPRDSRRTLALSPEGYDTWRGRPKSPRAATTRKSLTMLECSPIGSGVTPPSARIILMEWTHPSHFGMVVVMWATISLRREP